MLLPLPSSVAFPLRSFSLAAAGRSAFRLSSVCPARGEGTQGTGAWGRPFRNMPSLPPSSHSLRKKLYRVRGPGQGDSQNNPYFILFIYLTLQSLEQLFQVPPQNNGSGMMDTPTPGRKHRCVSLLKSRCSPRRRRTSGRCPARPPDEGRARLPHLRLSFQEM